MGFILQTARIYSYVPVYEFGGRSAVGFCAENVIGVQYKQTNILGKNPGIG